jgi:hypothetical protein
VWKAFQITSYHNIPSSTCGIHITISCHSPQEVWSQTPKQSRGALLFLKWGWNYYSPPRQVIRTCLGSLASPININRKTTHAEVTSNNLRASLHSYSSFWAPIITLFIPSPFQVRSQLLIFWLDNLPLVPLRLYACPLVYLVLTKCPPCIVSINHNTFKMCDFRLKGNCLVSKFFPQFSCFRTVYEPLCS